jgi:predicted alpha/beta-fold hydrolase
LKSPKLSCAASSEDAWESINYVANKYIKDKKTLKKRQKLFAYGVSLGGLMLGRCLIIYGK